MLKLKSYPIKGKYGKYGGQFVPETLMEAIEELEDAYEKAKIDPEFQSRLEYLLSEYAGRPTPLYYAENLSKSSGGARIYLKREDLAHGGAHKINNTLGQALLAERMGKKRIIAETGAGQHGVATALACSLLGLKCRIYMGAVDCERQKPNVFRMRLMGAEVIPVTSGSSTLKDACNEALRDWYQQRRLTMTTEKSIFVNQIQEGQAVADLFMVKDMSRAETRAGKPYLIMTLMDRSGEIGGRLWENADAVMPACAPGNLLHITGQAQAYRGSLQIRVDRVQEIDKTGADITLFLQTTRKNRDVLFG